MEGQADTQQTSLSFKGPDNWYALSFSTNPAEDLKVALGSIKENNDNNIDILKIDQQYQTIKTKFKIPHKYPPTKLKWGKHHPGLLVDQLLASTSDCLNIFQIDEDSFQHKCELKNSQYKELASPMTSFAWNPVDYNQICCSSIDTTCSLWDIEQQQLSKLVITHDKEVFDVSFSPDGRAFVTVGADNTARYFDTQNLNESTIIHEHDEPLIRIAWNNSTTSHLIAITSLSGNDIILLDIRKPLYPVSKLTFHQQPINNLAWSPESPFLLCSISGDQHAYLWNVEKFQSDNCVPTLEYSSDIPLNNVEWCSYLDWIGISKENSFIMLRIF